MIYQFDFNWEVIHNRPVQLAANSNVTRKLIQLSAHEQQRVFSCSIVNHNGLMDGFVIYIRDKRILEYIHHANSLSVSLFKF